MKLAHLDRLREEVVHAGRGATLAIGRLLTRRASDNEGEQPFLNRRGEQLVGRTVVLINGIENGVGRVSVDDTIWRAEGPDMPAGSRAVIAGVSGTTLKVTAA